MAGSLPDGVSSLTNYNPVTRLSSDKHPHMLQFAHKYGDAGRWWVIYEFGTTREVCLVKSEQLVWVEYQLTLAWTVQDWERLQGGTVIADIVMEELL